MKQITVSKITHARLQNFKSAIEFHNLASDNKDGTVSFLVRDNVYECLSLLAPDIEQAIINVMNSPTLNRCVISSVCTMDRLQ